jgi:uncharacterized protein (DUF305 family)
MFLSLPAIGSIAFSPTALVASHPMIAYEIVGHTIGHILYRFIKRTRKKRGLSRAQMRKMTNRRRRQFVDNIIMHHQRLAKMNRQTIAGNARERAMARREKIKRKDNLQRDKNSEKEQEIRKKWQGGVSLKERGQRIRGTIDARRTRARSRWLTIVADKPA